MHYFWECTKIAEFWSQFSEELNSVFKCKICKDLGLFLLGLSSKTGLLDSWSSKLLGKFLLLARKCILFNWIQEKPPSVTQWYREISRVLPMETLSAKLKEKEDNFLNIWWPLISYLPRDLSAVISRGNDSFDWRYTFTLRIRRLLDRYMELVPLCVIYISTCLMFRSLCSALWL